MVDHQAAASQAAGGGDRVPFCPESMYHLVGSKLYFTVHEGQEVTAKMIRGLPALFFFSSTIPESYASFCDDFGPLDISMVVRFCEEIKSKMDHPLLAHRRIVFYTLAVPEFVTNSAFLLCCYLMIFEGLSPAGAWARFERVAGLPVLHYRDATFEMPTFHLSILDCLKGLRRAMDLAWFDAARFDVEKYDAFYESPSHDLNVMNPNFIAFACPKDEPDAYLTRDRKPSAHVEIFRQLGVSDVVRLNEKGNYSDSVFVDAGFIHSDLEFDDCTCPPSYIVERFLDVCDAAKGVVAVHCLAGLGRTGTLIGCHMIKHYGFTAAECIGYLRAMRPGSVIGRQQHYLELIAECEWKGNLPVCLTKLCRKSSRMLGALGETRRFNAFLRLRRCFVQDQTCLPWRP